MLYMHHRLGMFDKMTVVFIKLGNGITSRICYAVLLPNQRNGHSLALHLLFHLRQKTLQLFEAFISYSRFCITKEQVKLMITHPADSIIGKVFVYKFMNVLLDCIA